MQYYVRTDYVPNRKISEITAGKCYPIRSRKQQGQWIEGDNGKELFIRLQGCAHLNAHNWEIVSQEEIDQMNKTTQQRQLEEAQENLKKAQEQLESLQESMKQESLWSHEGTGMYRVMLNYSGDGFSARRDKNVIDAEYMTRFNTEEEADLAAQDLQNTLILSQLAAFCNKGVAPDEEGWRWYVYFVVSSNAWNNDYHRDVEQPSVSFNSQAAADKACVILNSQDLGIIV